MNIKENNNLPVVAANQMLAKITKNQFLTDFSIQKIQKQCNSIDTVNGILKAELPTIVSIKRKFGIDFIQAYIEGWIVNIREFINVGKKMTDQQTQETAMLIVNEYYNLNLADINYIFKNAKLGRYGKYYDRLDGQVILSWFDEHFRNRCMVAADESVREADNFKDVNYKRTSDTLKLNDTKFQIEKSNFNIKG